MKSLLVTLLLFAAPPADADVEDRARALGKTLRCVVCQNQSIEESDAELAEDMRELVREELASGKSEAEVTALMRDRYGDYVLLKPPVQRNTLILWFAPLLLVGGALIWMVRARGSRADVPAPLSDSERARLDALRK